MPIAADAFLLAFQFLLLKVLRLGHEPKSGNRLGQQFRDYGDVVAAGAGTPSRLADSSTIVFIKLAFRNDGRACTRQLDSTTQISFHPAFPKDAFSLFLAMHTVPSIFADDTLRNRDG